MSSRTISAGHVLPQNPTFIDFPVSDGHESQWPANTTRVVDSEGHVNYMRPVPIDESLSIKWRCEVGASLALQLKKPGIFPALSLAGRLLTRFVVCASRQLAQPMSFVAGRLVIRCLIIIKGLQAHHDMMPTLSVRLFVCLLHISHQTSATQAHVTPNGSARFRNSYLMPSGYSQTRISFVPTATANIATKNHSAKSPHPWVSFPADQPRYPYLQHHVESMGRLLLTHLLQMLPRPRPCLHQLAKLVNERNLMQLSAAYPAL